MAINKKSFLDTIRKGVEYSVNGTRLPIGDGREIRLPGNTIVPLARGVKEAIPAVKRAVTSAGERIGSTIEGAGEIVRNYASVAKNTYETNKMQRQLEEKKRQKSERLPLLPMMKKQTMEKKKLIQMIDEEAAK